MVVVRHGSVTDFNVKILDLLTLVQAVLEILYQSLHPVDFLHFPLKNSIQFIQVVLDRASNLIRLIHQLNMLSRGLYWRVDVFIVFCD